MKRNILVTVPFLFMIGLTGIYASHSANAQSTQKDTIPKTDTRVNDEKTNNSGNETMKIEIQLSGKDWEQLDKDIKEAMHKIDLEKLKADIQKAISDVDVKRIKAEISKSLEELSDIEIRAKVEASVARADIEKARSELEKMKTEELKKIEVEIKNVKPEIDKAVREARKDVDKARKELHGHKEFIDQLNRDDLIDKEKGFEVNYREGKLTINGQVQPEDVAGRYQKFLEKHEQFYWKIEKK